MKREKQSKVRRISIRTKILMGAGFVVLAIVLILGIDFYSRMNKNMLAMAITQAEVAAEMVVGMVDGDELAQLKPGDEESEIYQRMVTTMRATKETCDVAYLYILETDKQKVYYVIDTDESVERCLIGEEFEDSYEELHTVFEGEKYVQGYIDSTEFGDLITVYMPIYNSNNEVVAVMGSDYDASAIVAMLNETRSRIILVGLAGLVAAVLVLSLVVMSVMRGINSVNDKIYELVNREGDLTQILQVKTGDEMEILADNVNSLLEYIRRIMLNIAHNSAELDASTDEVVRNLDDARDSITDVSATMEEMSAAMEETSATISQVSESVYATHGSIDRISEQAKEGAASAKEIQDRAIAVYEKAEIQKAEAEKMAAEMVTNINSEIEKSKSVAEIESLTQNILEITSQTNLLALNASIEAARAGEAGKGFAVVATEIGKLAESSAQSASKIQRVSREVVDAVEGLAAEAEKMSVFMEENAMEGYRRLIVTSGDYRQDAEQIHDTMQTFSDKSHELKRSIDVINDAIQSVNVTIGESTEGVVNTATRAAELTENVVGIHEKADTNKQIVLQLEGEVKKFKLQ